ncbi:MAG: hypothetical protein AAF958_09650, partial [Planctomycetota bacterium]
MTRRLGFHLPAVVVLSAIAVLPGCAQRRYTLRLKMDGDEMVRRLEFELSGPPVEAIEDVEGDSQEGELQENENEVDKNQERERQTPAILSDAEVQQWLKIYPEPIQAVASSVVLETRFRDVAPRDLGGGGGLLALPTSMGTLYHYSERMKVHQDFEGAIADQIREVDQAIDFACDFARFHLRDTDDEAAFADWIDQRIRHDAHDFLLYGHLQVIPDLISLNRSETPGDFFKALSMSSVLRFAIDREYLKLTELPRLMQLYTNGTEAEQQRDMVNRLLRLYESDTGKKRSPEMTLWLEREAAKESMAAYVSGLDEYKQAVKDWQVSAGPDDEMPTPLGWIDDQSSELLIKFVFPRSTLNASLRLPSKPTYTNGTWDDVDNTCQWEFRLDDPLVPPHLSASWVVIDDEFQTRLLGEKRLAG